MSIKVIKSTLETKLNTNMTAIAIKWNDTTSYTLNSVPLTSVQVDNLTNFLAPKIIPISQDREIMSSATPRKFEVFFQVDIFSKVGGGTGNDYDLVEALDAVFFETITSDVVVERSTVLTSFQVDGFLITPVRYLASLMA